MALIWIALGGLSLSLILFYKFFPLIWAVLYTPPEEIAIAIKDQAFIYSSQISFLWAIVSSSLLIFSALLISWFLRNRRRLLYSIIFIPWATPMYLATLSLRFSIYGIGGESIVSRFLRLNVNITTNHVAAFLWTLLVNNWVYLPIITLSFLATIDEIPDEIFEAARLDGAKEHDILFSIVIPYLAPTISGWFLMHFVKFFHSFTIPFLFADGGAPVMNAITKWGGFGNLYTLGILNYKVFSLSQNIETVVAYSVVSVLIVFFITSFWFFRSRENTVRLIGF
ncbi:MAG: sugar ABC transporter permease [Thermotogaceae bacterium]|nr:sugar ABC transporter permease [Thermotogaceae bacterium]